MTPPVQEDGAEDAVRLEFLAWYEEIENFSHRYERLYDMPRDDAIFAAWQAASAGKAELLEAIRAFMDLDKSFYTTCDAHLDEIAKTSAMGRAVKLARSLLSKHGA